MIAFLEGLAVFGIAGMSIVFFTIMWVTTDFDAMEIVVLDYMLMSTAGLAILLKINDFMHDIKKKKRKRNGKFKQSDVDRIRY